MVVMSDGELGFHYGEGVWEMATTYKEGNRCTNYQSRHKKIITINNNTRLIKFGNWN